MKVLDSHVISYDNLKNYIVTKYDTEKFLITGSIDSKVEAQKLPRFESTGWGVCMLAVYTEFTF